MRLVKGINLGIVCRPGPAPRAIEHLPRDHVEARTLTVRTAQACARCWGSLGAKACDFGSGGTPSCHGNNILDSVGKRGAE